MTLVLEMALEVQKHLQAVKAIKGVPRQQRQMEARLNSQLQGLFADVQDEVVRELQRIGKVPSDDSTRRRVVRAIEEAMDRVMGILGEGAEEAGQYGRDRVINDLRQAGISIGSGLEKMPDRTLEILKEHVFEASQRTMDRIKGDVMGSLIKSQQDGLGIDDAAAQLNDRFERIKDYELRRIARTEILSSQNKGSHESMREMNVEFEQWIMSDDERVRGNPAGLYPDTLADHWEMDGEIVRTGEPFSNGLQHPGDRNGPIEEWINCRCRVRPFIMPEGKRPPSQTYFYEADLLKGGK